MSRSSRPTPPATVSAAVIAGFTLQQAKARTRSHPQDALAWKSLGYHQYRNGEIDQGRANLQRSLALDDQDADTHAMLGLLEQQQGDDELARNHFSRALKLSPNSTEANLGMSDVHAKAGGYDQAMACLDRLSPQAADGLPALTRRGPLLFSKHRYGDAEALFRKLTERQPNQPEHWNSLGNALRALGRLDEAYVCYDRATTLLPTDPVPRSNYLTSLHYDPKASVDTILKASQAWGAMFTPTKAVVRPSPADKSANRVLRIGMISDGFRQHPVGAMTTPALVHLGRYGIELHAYTTSNVVDAITKRIMGACASWQPISHMSDEALAQRIREDRIDILIDLSGHNTGTRMRVLTLEPAPVLVKWVGGLIGTTGVKAIDYLISDRVESPPGSDAQYTEKLIRMPDDYICYLPPANVPPVAPLPALRNGYITFGCFNNPTKINPELLGQWAFLMHQVPNSRLLLKGGQFESLHLREQITQTMAGHGIDASRVRMDGHSRHVDLLATYNEVDVALDPWPYSGGLTTCEAMLMGVPVVTLPGPTFAGRHSATHLVNAGMPELVVDDWDAYRARVLELVGDLQSLSTIRSHLRDILLQSPVCDGERFAVNLANALRAIWQRYTEGKAPAALVLDAEGVPYFEDEAGPTDIQHPAIASEDPSFQWQFQGKIIAIDNGGNLVSRANVQKMLKRRTLELVVFDPASNAANSPATQQPDLHYYANMSLGDGKPATLFACLDATQSGSLEPLPADGPGAPTGVLARLPLNTVALDRINGLPSLDWLVLDAYNDSAAILDNGARVLANALIIEARVSFQPTHARQPNLAELQHWASHHGFQLYRLHDMAHAHPSKHPGMQGLQATATLHADALFIPGKARLQALDTNARTKLAFLLHGIYGLEDIAYEVLSPLPESGRFLDDVHVAKVLGANSDAFTLNNVRSVPEAESIAEVVGHMGAWSDAALDALINRGKAARDRDGANNTAHFVQTHALLAKGGKAAPAELRIDPSLLARLTDMGWRHKAALYAHWFDSARRYTERPDAKISAVLISNRYKPEIVETARILRAQKQGEIEILFVNNGAPAEDFAALVPFLDVWVELNGNSGAYLARNLGAVFAKAPILFFVEDDGIPQDGFVDAHLAVHASHQPVCLRGVYTPRTPGSECPPHYRLGDQIMAAPPILEGNASFNTQAFVALGGWGDYVLFGHGGFEFSRRLEQAGVPADKQLYTPDSVLLHDYLRGDDHRKEKFSKQQASHLLLQAGSRWNGRAAAGRACHAAEILQALGAPAALLPRTAAATSTLASSTVPPIPVVRTAAALRCGTHKVRTLVAVPLYNEEKYVEQTIQSLKAQDADGVHFLLGDNASTDRTLEIAQDAISGDARFEILGHAENVGAFNNFRFLLEQTRSDYFMWLGGHDYLSSNYLSLATRLLDTEPDVSMACGTPFRVQDGNTSPLGEAIYDFSDPHPLKRYLKSVTQLVNCTIVQSLFRRSQASDLELREVLSWDKIFISHLLWKGRLAYLEDAKYFRRYFQERVSTASERITGKKEKLERGPFREYYRDDLNVLARETLAPAELARIQEQVENYLIDRYRHY
ncbi:TPR domain protein, putative component of TonB system [plant metagenome]|uniref:protein O-GlcNAc transferase n=1 Tax=plant metagenome TaxID=1297885 RepID=A0A484P9X8_9ZZZZ